MDVRAVIIGVSWLAVIVISSAYMGFTYAGIGGINEYTSIVVGLLAAVGFIVTLGIAFGVAKEGPSTKALAQMSTELMEMKALVSDLDKKVDAIQKEFEE